MLGLLECSFLEEGCLGLDTMRGTPRHHTQRSYTAQTGYTVGGLVVYAALVPAVVVLLAAPVMTSAFVLGLIAAVGVSRVRARQRSPGDEDRNRAENRHSREGGLRTGTEASK